MCQKLHSVSIIMNCVLLCIQLQKTDIEHRFWSVVCQKLCPVLDIAQLPKDKLMLYLQSTDQFSLNLPGDNVKMRRIKNSEANSFSIFFFCHKFLSVLTNEKRCFPSEKKKKIHIQSLHHLCHFLLGLRQDLHISLALRSCTQNPRFWAEQRGRVTSLTAGQCVSKSARPNN